MAKLLKLLKLKKLLKQHFRQKRFVKYLDVIFRFRLFQRELPTSVRRLKQSCYSREERYQTREEGKNGKEYFGWGGAGAN